MPWHSVLGLSHGTTGEIFSNLNHHQVPETICASSTNKDGGSGEGNPVPNLTFFFLITPGHILRSRHQDRMRENEGGGGGGESSQPVI